VRIACGGVFDRHPGATLILGHMGEFLPFQASRFDSRYATMTPAARPLRRKPSEYFGRNVVITTSGVFEPAVLRAAIDVLGADAVLFAVDDPYESSRDAVELIRRAPMTDAERHQVAHGNAERLLRLPAAARAAGQPAARAAGGQRPTADSRGAGTNQFSWS
jgi:2,3-dihydroxybenzoate decarboxylase